MSSAEQMTAADSEDLRSADWGDLRRCKYD